MKAAKKVALIGIFSALSMVLSILEQFVPIGAIIPLPGVKLGLANLITLSALILVGFPSALTVLVVRCSLTALLFGTPVSFAMSLGGGIIALLGMYAAAQFPRRISIFGISIIGAAGHNIGQTAAAAIVLRSISIFAYLPILLLVSLLTGILIASIVRLLLKHRGAFQKYLS